MKTCWLFHAAACAVYLALNAQATTHYVDLNSTNPTWPYTNWVTAATNIQDAFSGVAPGDTVLVTNGVYGSGTGLSSRVHTFNPILLQSVNGPAVTVIQGYQVPGTTNGTGAVRCVFLQAGSTLSGFTLTNGATASGDSGGGVYCASSNCVVTNCVIVGNSAWAGGGGAFSGTLVNCLLKNNFADTLNVGSGGGAAQSSLINCVITGNHVGYIGGGAISCTLVNCTVVSNFAAANAGSLANCTAKNSIVYYNHSYFTGDDSGSSFTFFNCCLSFAPTSGANNITNPPQFANPAAGDYRLTAVSPCINAGNNSFVLNATDLDGNPRILGNIVDMGAYEYSYSGATHYVKLDCTNPVSPYTSWFTAATNIQDAVDAATTGDLILVTNGVYDSGGGLMANRVAITKAVTLLSVNGPDATMIVGDTTMRGVYVGSNAILSGFTITHGQANNGSGGGVWCEASGIVTNCVICSNSSYSTIALPIGGGVYGGILYNCTITRNSSYSGAGAYHSRIFNSVISSNFTESGYGYGAGAYQCILSNCLIVGNTAFYNTSGGGTFQGINYNCLFVGNRCVLDESGLYSLGSGGGSCQSTNYNCILVRNSASSGGGSWGGENVNCLINSNSAFFNGGGVYGGAHYNCTIVNNSVTNINGGGGGAYQANLFNSIIYFNTATNGPNWLSAYLGACCTTPSGYVTADPVFVDQAGGNFRLQTNSPCVDVGYNGFVTGSKDLDGRPRIVSGNPFFPPVVDIGAYEFQTNAPGEFIGWLQQYGLPTDGSADYADTDNDRMKNWQEWMAGTDPTNALSLLEMLSLASTNSPLGINVTWQSVTNRTYFLQRRGDLSAQPPFSTIQNDIAGQAGTTTYTDTSATNDGPYFYRVGVQ